MIKRWQDIPGFFDFWDIYNEVVDEAQDGDKLVEVGAFLGKSVAYLADRTRASKKDLKILAIDSWDHPLYVRWWEMEGHLRPEPWLVEELVGMPLYDAFVRCLESAGVFELVTPIRGTSVSSDGFADQSLFFVFLDADHEYESVRDDIRAWKDKIRPGGIIAGHDYRRLDWPGVTRAVDEAFGSRVEHRNNSWLVRVG